MLKVSFRTKLLLTMMLVVLGVTGVTLYVAQSRVEATYQGLFQKLFDAQVSSFTDMQRTRLSFVAEKCEALVQSVRLKALLEEGDAELLYDNAADELRELSQSVGRRSAASFFRFLDVHGEVIPTTNPRAGLTRPRDRIQLRTQLATIKQMMSEGKGQQIGFLATDGPDNQVHLQEMIITKIGDDIGGQVRGALVLAFPVPELLQPGTVTPNSASDPRLTASGLGEELMLGIWVGGVLYSRTDGIPAAVRESLSRQIETEVLHATTPRHDLTISVGGVPHRVFYRSLNTGSSFPAAYQVCLYSLASAQRDQETLRSRILLFGGLILLGAFAFSFVLSHGLSVPIRELAGATNEIRRGNLSVKVPVRSHDDLGNLASSFNEMAVGLAQKEKYRSILNMIADERVAQQLVDGQILLGGERRVVSVLFCDIRGFTSLTENMSPEEVIAMLNEHMTSLTQVVQEHEGVVDKFVGDLIMALFGAPVTRGRDAAAAVSCAWHMMAARRKLNETSRYQIEIGIGLATGEMVAGCMGSQERVNYTVLGPRVNLAARLCSQARAGQIVIDQETRDRLATEIEVAALPPLNLKGFREPIAAYELVALQREKMPQ